MGQGGGGADLPIPYLPTVGEMCTGVVFIEEIASMSIWIFFFHMAYIPPSAMVTLPRTRQLVMCQFPRGFFQNCLYPLVRW